MHDIAMKPEIPSLLFLLLILCYRFPFYLLFLPHLISVALIIAFNFVKKQCEKAEKKPFHTVLEYYLH